MHLLKQISFCLLLPLLLCLPIISYSLPHGSYIETCKRCQISHHNLTCRCQTRDQRWHWTTLTRVHRCRTVRNINGNLRCHEHATALPAGSYLNSCRRCQYDGHQLRCYCQRRDQSVTWSVLHHANRCFRIVNHNGRLKCH